MSGEYEGFRRVIYGEDDDENASFIPVCPNCGRFVKADEEILMNELQGPIGDNATCKKCGRVKMLFEEYI